MAGMAVAQRMTVAEFLALPEQRWASLIEGEVVVNQPRPLHQRVVLDLAFGLMQWTRAEPRRGEVTTEIAVELDEFNWFGPDVLWYREGRGPGRADTAPQPMPDIAAEIRSPSTWRYDIGPKKARYEQYGLPELWLVDTAADVVLVFRRSAPQAPTFDVCLELARGDALTSPCCPASPSRSTSCSARRPAPLRADHRRQTVRVAGYRHVDRGRLAHPRDEVV